MNEHPLEYYTSDISEPFGTEVYDGVDVQEEGYIVFKQQSILNSIGTKACEANINLFFDEVIDEMTHIGIHQYSQDCLSKMIEVYNLASLIDIVNNPTYFIKYGDKVFDLLKFLESDRCIELVAKCLPFASLEVLSKKDQFIEFLNINYKDYLKGIEANRFTCPDLFYEFVLIHNQFFHLYLKDYHLLFFEFFL